MASPTVVRVVQRSRSMVRQASAGSNVLVSGGRTTAWPLLKAMNATHWAAPCMSGGMTKNLRGSGNARACAATSSYDSTVSWLRMFRPPIAERKMSCWRQSTPFGMPVVPPV